MTARHLLPRFTSEIYTMPEKDSPPKTHEVTLAAIAKATPSLTVKVITASAAAASVATTEDERDAILRLGEIFAAMDDRQLYVYLENGEPIGPLIGVTDIPEGVIRGCAAYEARERQARKDSAEARQAGRREGMKVGAAYAGPSVALLVLVAKLLGWL